MSTPDRTPDDQLRIPEEVARRLFARASELDATGARMLTVAQARDAAHQAGISLPAFEAALAELRQQQAVAPATQAGTALHRPRRHVARVTVLAAALVLGLGMWFVRAASTHREPSPADVIVTEQRTTVDTRVDTVVVETPRATRPASPNEPAPARAPQ